MKRLGALALTVLTIALTAPTVRGYLKLGTDVNGRSVALRWTTMPVRYFVTNRDTYNVSATQLQAAVQQAFASWADASDAPLSAQFAGFTGAEPFVDDGVNVIGFSSRPELERTLGATTFNVDDTTGQILESDIFLNSAFPWSVAASGEPGRYDATSIATHEIGHLLGLGHSALGETELRATGGRRVLGKQAIMFPIAFPAGNVSDRTPKPDDAAGIGELYASSDFNRRFGQITGRVTLNGRGLFGAHVTVFDTSTGDLVSGFCLNDQGAFTIGGLAPGVYVVRAEPLDDADVDSFFDSETKVEISFKPTYFNRLVAVPAGGAGPAIEIKVAAK